MEVILILAIVYLLYSSGILSSSSTTIPTSSLSAIESQVSSALGINPCSEGSTGLPGAAASVAAQLTSQINTQAQQETALVNSGIQVAEQGAQLGIQASNIAGATASQLSTAIPIVGSALQAVTGILLSQSAARQKAATSENQAVNQSTPAWDAALKQVVCLFNQGQLTGPQLQKLLGTIMQNYWTEVCNVIQSGRNGCDCGANCPGSATPNSPVAFATTAPSTYCSGNIGAACCVGCSDLALGIANVQYAATLAAKNGGAPVVAYIPAVFPSKYGTLTRPSYTVSLQAPVAT